MPGAGIHLDPEKTKSVDNLLNSSNTASASSRTRLFSNRLVRELAVVLVIKLIILYFIWLAFFSQPRGPQITAETVSETFLGVGSDGPSPQQNDKIKQRSPANGYGR